MEEQASGAKDRPQLVALLDSLEAGDTLAVWKFDRLGRSLPDLLDIVTRIEAKAAHLVSLTEQIDTSTSSGPITKVGRQMPTMANDMGA